MEKITTKKTVDIIVPFFNEEEGVVEFLNILTDNTAKIQEENPNILFNYILIENGSTDNTYSILLDQISNKDEFKAEYVPGNLTLP